jgi:probable HAF family extracellular repeat protein
VGATIDATVMQLPVQVEGGVRLGLNDRGRVFGMALTEEPGEDEGSFGFVWDPQHGLCNLGWGAWPTSINASGLVVGSRLLDENTSRPFLFEPGTGLQTLKLPKGWSRFTRAFVNDRGQVAGAVERGGDEEETSEAHLWDPEAGWTGFGRGSGVQDLNEASQVLINVGGADQATYDHHLVLWTPEDSAEDLGDGDYGLLNDAGQVAWGRYDQTSFKEQVSLWDPRTGTHRKVVIGRATGLNGRGQVVGEMAGVEDAWDIRAFMWSTVDGLTDLGTLPGADWSTALGINEQGQVVGYSGTGPPGEPDWYHAFVWDERTGMRDLGTFAEAEQAVAVAINDAGQVLGRSTKDSDPGGAGTVVIWQLP